MIYELRTYWAAAGKTEALHARFRTLTLRVFARHQMQLIGFWTPQPPTADTGDLVYLLAFADRDAMTQAWDAFRADKEWQAGRAASEVDGSLVKKVASVVMQPTNYSPLQ